MSFDTVTAYFASGDMASWRMNEVVVEGRVRVRHEGPDGLTRWTEEFEARTKVSEVAAVASKGYGSDIVLYYVVLDGYRYRGWLSGKSWFILHVVSVPGIKCI